MSETITTLTGGQVHALAVMARVNINRGSRVTDWVDRGEERINKWSVRALATRGVVIYGADLDVVRVREKYADLAEECRSVVEEGPK